MNAISHRFTLPKCSTACLPRLPSWWPACPHISCSGFRMNAFGEWAFSGRTLHNQKRLICQVCNIFFPGAFSGMCHRRWGRWAMEQRVLGTSHQVIKCPSIPFQNLMKTSIFINYKKQCCSLWECSTCFWWIVHLYNFDFMNSVDIALLLCWMIDK